MYGHANICWAGFVVTGAQCDAGGIAALCGVVGHFVVGAAFVG